MVMKRNVNFAVQPATVRGVLTAQQSVIATAQAPTNVVGAAPHRSGAVVHIARQSITKNKLTMHEQTKRRIVSYPPALLPKFVQKSAATNLMGTSKSKDAFVLRNSNSPMR